MYKDLANIFYVQGMLRALGIAFLTLVFPLLLLEASLGGRG